MAKTPKTTIDDELIPLSGELIPVNTEANALIIVTPLENQLIALESEADMVVITDKASYENAVLVCNKLKKYSSGANKTRLAFTLPVRTMLETIKSRVDGWIDRSNAKLKIVEDKVNAEAIKIAAAVKAERIRRMDLLHANGWSVAGEFYICGGNRIMLEQIDTATDQSLALWVHQGEQEKARLAAEQLAQDTKTAEFESREAALKMSETEMDEFRKWKALQNAAPVIEEIPVFTPAMSPSKSFEEDLKGAGFGALSSGPRVGISSFCSFGPPSDVMRPVFVAPTIPEFVAPSVPGFDAPIMPEHIPLTITVSESDYDELTNATKQAFNDGIDAVCNNFINNPAKLDRQSWVALWQTLKL